MIRPLLPAERSALEALLSCDFEGAAVLRRQASTALAEGRGLIIQLVVDDSLPRATVAARVPVEAPVTDDDGNANGLLLYVDEGRLSGLEYWWTGDEAPERFPDPGRVGQPRAVT